MRLLALETATEACSAALWIEGRLREVRIEEPRQHARRILSLLEGLLAEAGLAPSALDAVAFGRGPGSFTGVRIAAGVTQGVALGADLPVVPVSTLLALGQAALEGRPPQPVLAALDARMGEVYFLAARPDEAGLLEPLTEERVVPPDRVEVPEGGPWLAAGSGWLAYGEELRRHVSASLEVLPEKVHPTASAVARLAVRAWERGERVAPEQAQPVYLRDRVADERARVDESA